MANHMSREAEALAKELLHRQKQVSKAILVGYKELCTRAGVPFNRKKWESTSAKSLNGAKERNCRRSMH
jgi:hypothetical protein